MSKLEQLLHEVNAHLPDGLKLTPPVTKKAMRYARSCLAYTYQSESMGTEGARVLGPLNATLDKIEEIVAREKDATRDAPPPDAKGPPPSKPKPQPASSSSSSSSSSSASPPHDGGRPRWRDADPDNETPAERTFREALEAVERANAQRGKDDVVRQSQQAREALDVVDRYLHGDRAGAAAPSTPEGQMIQELRRALLLTFQKRSGRPG